ncbi:hypothetical protein JQX13_15165 [Archangium violaceum]|uniref:hypothetical protein n=1 Tax=Archangium violaceum TaxID=83451 RepID=UPI00193C094F|nr:hypothetical protein [Archangium violaceum]QRK11293.1 hypothetical protein JQX13_15165 [Archangium violaceum]
MKYMRKDVSELLAAVGGSPDVATHATTSTFGNGITYVSITYSGSAFRWEPLSGSGGRLCEDGAAYNGEDMSSCYSHP